MGSPPPMESWQTQGSPQPTGSPQQLGFSSPWGLCSPPDRRSQWDHGRLSGRRSPRDRRSPQDRCIAAMSAEHSCARFLVPGLRFDRLPAWRLRRRGGGAGPVPDEVDPYTNWGRARGVADRTSVATATRRTAHPPPPPGMQRRRSAAAAVAARPKRHASPALGGDRATERPLLPWLPPARATRGSGWQPRRPATRRVRAPLGASVQLGARIAGST